MKKKCSIIFTLCLAFTILTGCSMGSRTEIEKALKSSLTVDWGYESVSNGKNEDGYTTKTYYYKDENGVEFNVLYDYHSGSGGVPHIINTCNYAVVLLEVQKETIEKALESDLSFTWYPTNRCYGINIYNYDDLMQASVSIEKALNSSNPFTINHDEFTSYYKNCLPSINVYYPDKNMTIGEFYFLCYGETPPTQLQILDELQNSYKKNIEGN